ncbi:MAG: cbb3-type cytochrome c oxidase maturation protein CcoH [Ignavibacteria bacterium]|nr:cbb3-type cytochrome c oxidase maturation protein CcoH [Ignavibacteria bacterium]
MAKNNKVPLFLILMFTIFPLVLITGIIISLNINEDLVEPDYYTKGLKFQTQIDKTIRGKMPNVQPEIGINNNILTITFPTNNTSGIIRFMRNDNKATDFSVKISIDSTNRQNFDFSHRKRGLWLVKIDWQIADSTYYIEKEIYY